MELTSNYSMAQGQAAAKPSSMSASRNNNANAEAISQLAEESQDAELIDKSDQAAAFESMLNQASNPEPTETKTTTNTIQPVDANSPALMTVMPEPVPANDPIPIVQNIVSPVKLFLSNELIQTQALESDMSSSAALTAAMNKQGDAGKAEPIAFQSAPMRADETMSQTAMDKPGSVLPAPVTPAAITSPLLPAVLPETGKDAVITPLVTPADAVKGITAINPIPASQIPHQTDDLKKPEQMTAPAPGAPLIPQPANETHAPLSLQTGGAAEDGKNPQPANTVPLDVSGIQQSMNPTPSQATPQTAPLMPANPVPEIKPVQNQGLAATAKSERQNDNSAIKPSYNANMDKTGDAPAATANAPQNGGVGAQAQPMDTQSFVQTLTRNSDAQALAAPDGAAQDASVDTLSVQSGNVIYLDKAETARQSGVAASVRPETPQNHTSPPVRDIALHISQHADNGINRFQLRLDPPELGRVEVRMEISAEGKLSAVIAVERPETLDLLQRDGRALERSLLEAGLKTDGNSLSFSLKGGRHDNPQSDGVGSAAGMAENTALNEWDESLTPINARFANRAVNIRI